MHPSKVLATLLAAALAVGATPVPSTPLVVLSPSTAWAIDENPESCAVQGWFEGSGNTVLLDWRQFDPGDTYQLTIASETLGRVPHPVPEVRFDPDPDWETYRGAQTGTIGEKMAAVALFEGVYPIAFIRDREARMRLLKPGEQLPEISDSERDAFERSVTGLSVKKAFSQDIQLKLSKVHGVAQLLRGCMDRMITGWGLDPQTERTLSKRPTWRNRAKVASLIQAAYPADKMGMYWNARIRLRIIIDEAGEIKRCRVQLPIPIIEFEQTACGIINRQAKFDPAIDAAGQPVKSFFSLTIVYATS